MSKLVDFNFAAIEDSAICFASFRAFECGLTFEKSKSLQSVEKIKRIERDKERLTH